jgi:hypothetical protein
MRAARQAAREVQVALLRDVIGNPFRPRRPVDPAWLTPTVVAIARGAYDDRDFAALPVLADALEDAGCDDTDLLGHLRGPGVHGRGCWVVDWLLARK